MKFGIVTTMNALPWAGSEELWYGAALELLREGHEVHVYYPAVRGWAPQLGAIAQRGAQVHAFGWPSGRWTHAAGMIGRRWADFPVLHPCPRDGAWKQLDFVLVSQGGCLDGQPWLELLTRRCIPFAVLCQANMECVWPDDATAERVRNYYAQARAVYFVSAENERLFRIQTGYEHDNAAVVWNPLQPSTPAQPLPWPEADDGRVHVAMVGRIEPFAKGQDLMLEVLSSHEWRSRPLAVTIYGKGPWERTAQLIIERRRLTQVRLGGYATPSEVWASHGLLALPSRHEGMSLAMLEALWLGRPVLATAVAGALSEIEDGWNGFLCAGASVDSWAEGLERAWEQRARWPAMGERGARRIRQRMGSEPAGALARRLSVAAGIGGAAGMIGPSPTLA